MTIFIAGAYSYENCLKRIEASQIKCQPNRIKVTIVLEKCNSLLICEWSKTWYVRQHCRRDVSVFLCSLIFLSVDLWEIIVPIVICWHSCDCECVFVVYLVNLSPYSNVEIVQFLWAGWWTGLWVYCCYLVTPNHGVVVISRTEHFLLA